MGGFVMNSRRQFLKVLGSASAGMLLAGTKPLWASENMERLTILHTNDLHCRIEPFGANHPHHPNQGGLAMLSGMVKKVREQEKNVLLLDSGDMFQGTPYFNFYKGELILKLMSKMGYDAGTIGNHEFDNGLEGLKKVWPHAAFPIVNANYDFSNTVLKGMMKPYMTLQKGNLKIGIYGLGVKLDGLVSPKSYGETGYLDPIEVALKMEKLLKREQQCDVVICLSHLGYEYKSDMVSDVLLARHTKMTDMILGGHTHTFLDQPAEIKNKAGKKVLVNQAGWGGLVLGRIDLTIKKSK